MNEKKIEKYRWMLQGMLERLRGDTLALEDETRTRTGGEAGGNLSNVPMHLGDLGTDAYMQELNSSLLESESTLRDEVLAAIARIESRTYGKCEDCGRTIKEARLEVIPYARYCAACAARFESEQVISNPGRIQETGVESVNLPKAEEEEETSVPRPNESEILFSDLASLDEEPLSDIHAAGTPGGGSAIGGLAGTNVGGGDPNGADLESAMGSGTFDTEQLEEEEEEEEAGYSGFRGGAVGGTPAGKRAVGGKREGRSPTEAAAARPRGGRTRRGG